MEKLRIGSVQEIKCGSRKGLKVKIIGRMKVEYGYYYIVQHLDGDFGFKSHDLKTEELMCIGKRYKDIEFVDKLHSLLFEEKEEKEEEIDKKEIDKMIGTVQEVEILQGAFVTIPKCTKVKIVGIHKYKAEYSREPMYIVEWNEGYRLSTYLNNSYGYPEKLMDNLYLDTHVWVINQHNLKGFGGNNE